MSYPYHRLMKPRLGTPLNKGHRLSKGLVGCWLMNEGSGNKVFDVSRNNRIGTPQAGVWVPGKFGVCLNNQGTVPYNRYLTFPWIYTGTASFALWVYETSAGDYAYLWDMRTSGGTGYVYSTSTAITTSSGTVYVDGVASTTWSRNTWHFLVVSGMSVVVTGTAVIGAKNDFDTALCHFGPFDIPQVWNRALSASEIAQLYREPFGIFDRPPIWSLYTVPSGAAGAMSLNTKFWGATI